MLRALLWLPLLEMVTSEESCEARCDVDALLAWAAQQSVEWSSSVQLKPIDGRGLGFIANESIVAGTRVLRVPATLMLAPVSAQGAVGVQRERGRCPA